MPRAKESTAGASTAQAQQDAVSDGIDSFELPRSLIMKLARASQVPENTKFSKDVILSIVKSSTVFVNYLAATAHEVASSKQHKSISATDVLKALELVEFTDIAKSIQGELPIHREMQKADKRKGGKPKAKDATSESASTASRAKGKGKAAAAESDEAEQQAIPPILIRPSASVAHPSSAEPGHGRSEDVDEDQEMMDQDPEEDGGEDMDEDMDDDEGDEEEPEDTMALEEEELRRDAKRLDAGNAIEED